MLVVCEIMLVVISNKLVVVWFYVVVGSHGPPYSPPGADPGQGLKPRPTEERKKREKEIECQHGKGLFLGLYLIIIIFSRKLQPPVSFNM